MVRRCQRRRKTKSGKLFPLRERTEIVAISSSRSVCATQTFLVTFSELNTEGTEKGGKLTAHGTLSCVRCRLRGCGVVPADRHEFRDARFLHRYSVEHRRHLHRFP